MGKNRDGVATEFQRKKLKALGYNKSVKTYREAENALKRISRAAKSDTNKNEDANAKAKDNPNARVTKAVCGISFSAVPLPHGCHVVGLVIAVPNKKDGRK